MKALYPKIEGDRRARARGVTAGRFEVGQGELLQREQRVSVRTHGLQYG